MVVAVVVAHLLVENVELPVVLVEVAAHLLVLVEQETLLLQLPLKEMLAELKFTLHQIMVVAAVEVINVLVLMVHQLVAVLVETEQIFVLLTQEL
tara:strand:- start:150 stop:434 length:285 start_codon:yes stop_codon:yes gene_type:complete